MSQNEFNPTSFNGEPLTTAKLNQLSNNIQFLFERGAKIRYKNEDANLTRDASLKVLAGKTAYPIVSANYIYQPVYFGSYFSAGCKPVVTATVEAPSGGHRNRVMVYGLSGGEIDNIGFQAVVTTEAVSTIGPSGWVHWIAVGY
jgi:hypothetical protein